MNERIDKIDAKIHAFLTTENVPDAVKTDSTKPLAGKTMGVKGVLSMAGKPSWASSKVLENYMPVYSATVVKKLVEAGAIIAGQTNCDSFAEGASTENSGFGPTRNPWDLSRVPGGSSGGSAAAVVAGEVDFALGTDTGGSIRQPASFCNVVGLKNTYGRCSRYGLMAMGSSFDTPGAFTKSVADMAKVLQVIAGYDPLDATSSKATVPDYSAVLGKGVEGVKIGLPKEYFGDGVSPEVKAAVLAASKELEKQGANLAEVSLPKTELALAVYYILVPSEISSNMGRYTETRFGNSRDLFEAEVKRRIMIGTYALSSGYYDAYYNQALKVRTLIIEDFKKAFASVDLLLGPVSPTTAFKIGEKAADPLSMYLADVLTCPSNVAGVPAISIPAGFDKNNLPIGLQLIAPHFREDLLLQVASTYEKVTDWHNRKPEIK
ncbi:MAG: Asp-tRNA(Asn)/Glu-tRNA(Gln) amidotransferase subunit GatA [candidate division WWE3 bacterium]|nr:Asp-tRNA(Asn)/Glu-tRNA(Gln) amidotransferase subunit GatA [candidate division WWE3 bacterium]